MLDTTRQGVRVWLVKVPVAVAEAIKNAQEGEKVGTLTVSRSSGGGGGGGGGGEELVSAGGRKGGRGGKGKRSER